MATIVPIQVNPNPHSTPLTTLPQNRNFLSPIPYKLIVQRTPNLDFFVQKINLPGVSSQQAMQSTMFTDLPHSGVKLRWNPLFVTFKIDEAMESWQEIFNWITAINNATSAKGQAAMAVNPKWTGLNVTSEMTLIIHDNERQPNYNIYFHDSFPITLTDLTFDGTKTDVEYLTCSATFLYSTYDMEKVI